MFGSNKQTLTITNLTCGHCISRITSSLKEIDEIKSVKIDLKSGKVDIFYKKELDLEKVKQKITDLGYKILKEDNK